MGGPLWLTTGADRDDGPGVGAGFANLNSEPRQDECDLLQEPRGCLIDGASSSPGGVEPKPK